MTNFYTSDLHLNHNNIIGFCDRPYHNVMQMNHELLKNWNETVAKKDTVYILGDLIMGQLKRGLEIVDQMNGNKFLIPGNHDKLLPLNKPTEDRIAQYENVGITILPHFQIFTIQNIRFGLTHFPHTTNPQYKYAEYVTQNNGAYQILLCGHIHEKWLTHKNQINVGVDVWDYKPVPEEWLVDMGKKLLKNK